MLGIGSEAEKLGWQALHSSGVRAFKKDALALEPGMWDSGAAGALKSRLDGCPSAIRLGCATDHQCKLGSHRKGAIRSY